PFGYDGQKMFCCYEKPTPIVDRHSRPDRESPSTEYLLIQRREFVVIGDIVFSNCCNPQSNIRNPKRYPIIGIPDLLSHRSGMTVKKCFVAMKTLRPSRTVIPDPIGNPRLRSTTKRIFY